MYVRVRFMQRKFDSRSITRALSVTGLFANSIFTAQVVLAFLYLESSHSCSSENFLSRLSRLVGNDKWRLVLLAASIPIVNQPTAPLVFSIVGFCKFVPLGPTWFQGYHFSLLLFSLGVLLCAALFLVTVFSAFVWVCLSLSCALCPDIHV